MDRFIERWGLSIKATPNPNFVPTDDWHYTASHWKIKIKSIIARGKIKCEYHMGQAHTDKPNLADVLFSLANDASMGYETHHEFCNICGCDIDSISAYRTWQLCQKVKNDLLHFFGPAGLNELFASSENY